MPAWTVACLMVVRLAACAPSTEEVRQEAFESFVEGERETVPSLLAAYPDVYTSVQVSGELDGDLGAIATIRFTYIHTRRVEYGSAFQPSWVVHPS